MPAPSQPGSDPSGRLLVVLLVALMCGFVLTSLAAQRTSAEVASLSEAIASRSSPSVERLALLRGVVFQLELDLSELLRAGAAAELERRSFETSLDSFKSAAESYLGLPLLPGEQPYWSQTQAALSRFESSIRSSADLARAGNMSAAREAFATAVRRTGNRVVESSLQAIEFHAQNSRAMATRIRETRRRALLLANALTAGCVALGVGGLLLVLRQIRRYRALMEAHSRFHEARADELEQFAGRVAHDIRNPLSAASMGTQLALRRAGDDGSKDLLNRILRSLSRADAITSALLDFARSGAQPEPGARTMPSEVLPDLVRGLSPEAERRRIELRLRPVPTATVACSPGVYLSLVDNLLRNAIKYMGDAAHRQISVEVTLEASVVRTEVIDTGPGIAPENLRSLFKPYFRIGRDRGKEGLGLGLATVKKLVEGHHGTIGVRSVPGNGSTFWFTLPHAASADARAESDGSPNGAAACAAPRAGDSPDAAPGT